MTLDEIRDSKNGEGQASVAVKPAPRAGGFSPEHDEGKHYAKLLGESQIIIGRIVGRQIVSNGEPGHGEIKIETEPPGKQESKIQAAETQITGGRFRMGAKSQGGEHQSRHKKDGAVGKKRRRHRHSANDFVVEPVEIGQQVKNKGRDVQIPKHTPRAGG